MNAYTLTFAVFLLTGAALGDRLGRRRVFATGSPSSRSGRSRPRSPHRRRAQRRPRGAGARRRARGAADADAAQRAVPAAERGLALGRGAGSAASRSRSGRCRRRGRPGRLVAVDLLAQRPHRVCPRPARAPAARREPRPRRPARPRRSGLASARPLRDRLGPRARQRPGMGEPGDRRGAHGRRAPRRGLRRLGAADAGADAADAVLPLARLRAGERRLPSSCSSGCSARSSSWRSSSRRCRATRRSGAGLRILPWTLAPMFIAPVAGALSDQISPRLIIGSGLTLQAVALAWIGLVSTPDVPYTSLIAPFIVAGVGMALFFAPVANVVLSAVRPRRRARPRGRTTRSASSVVSSASPCSPRCFRRGGYPSPQAFATARRGGVRRCGRRRVGAIAAFAIPRRQDAAEAVQPQTLPGTASRNGDLPKRGSASECGCQLDRSRTTAAVAPPTIVTIAIVALATQGRGSV